jgi:predicted transcriptional regulator
MARFLQNITDAEWAVLQLLWDEGPAPVRRLTDVLYPKGGASEYATVHKLLERLASKGYVRRQRKAGVFLFEAAVDRDDLLGRELESLVEKMCGGSLQPLLTNLVRVKRLTADELRELLALVESLDAKARPRKGRGEGGRP